MKFGPVKGSGSYFVPAPSIKDINNEKRVFLGASFFSGCGGSSTGHKMGGVEVLYANEFIPAAQDTYEANAPKAFMDRRDVRTVKAEDVLKVLGIKKGELDLLDGSPPCSSFSTAGLQEKGWGREKKYSDSAQRTDDLFDEFIRILRGIMPKVFVVENVPGMLTGKSKGMFLYILKAFEESGYKVSARVLRASRLGVPQARERLIFVGVRNDIAKMGFEPVHCKPYPLPEVSVRSNLPHIVAIKTKKDNLMQYVVSDIPSPTITASDASCSETAQFSSGAFIETKDGVRRKYNIEELRVICGFPKDFVFTGSFEQQFERMGRAVPPVMMAHITREIVANILTPYYKKIKKTPSIKAETFKRAAKFREVAAKQRIEAEKQAIVEKAAKQAAKSALKDANKAVKAQRAKGTAKKSSKPKDVPESTTPIRKGDTITIKETGNKYSATRLPDVRKVLIEQMKPHRKKKVGILMSAGLDSHAVLFACLELGMKPTLYSFTLEDRESRDYRMAKKTAEVFGLKFVGLKHTTDPKALKAGVIDTIKKTGADSKAAIECIHFFKFGVDNIKEDYIVSGLAADLYFVLTKKGCMHFKDDPDAYRLPKFATVQSPASQTHKMKEYCKSIGKEWLSPWLHPDMMAQFEGTTWNSANKPKQKYPIHVQFAEYVKKVQTYQHTNLQMGDSGIRELFAQLLDDEELNPGRQYKSTAGVYNRIMRGEVNASRTKAGALRVR